MKKINLTFSAAMLMLALYSCSGEKKNTEANTAATDSMPTAQSDTSLSNPADTAGNNVTAFALKAAAGGTMEVELGYLAQQKAQSPRVKQFGAMMIKDHTKANKELMALATAKNIMVPSKLPQDIQQHIDEMKKLSGAEFDKHYMSMMTDDHKDDIDQFETAAKSSKDNDIKAFAAKTLPVLKMHLDSAQAIKKDVK
jgi:putative membrane protein